MDLLFYLFPVSLTAIALFLGFIPRYKLVQLISSYLALAYITIISAFRGDVGFDWFTYRYLFEGLRNLNFTNAYNSVALSAYEPGFRALVALLINDSLKEQSLLVLSSLLLTGSVILLLSTFNPFHRPYVIGTWLLVSLYPIYFGQVRQALALSFTFLGLYIYNKIGSRVLAAIVISFGCLFHVSCIIYLLIFVSSMLHEFWLRVGQSAISWGICAFLVSLFNLNILTLFKFISPKVYIYELTFTSSRSPFQSFLWITLFALGCKLSSELIFDTSLRSLAISSLFYTVLTMVLFSGTYALFSRTFSLTSIYLGVISSYGMARSSKRSVAYSVSASCSVLLYVAIQIVYYWDQIIPYKFSVEL
jgi:hypothetical protein